MVNRLVWLDQDEAGDEGSFESDDTLDIMVNIVSVLPREFDRQMEVEANDWEVEQEMAKHRPVCYFVMGNGCTEEQNGFFEPPTEAMKSHLKPLIHKGKARRGHCKQDLGGLWGNYQHNSPLHAKKNRQE